MEDGMSAGRTIETRTFEKMVEKGIGRLAALAEVHREDPTLYPRHVKEREEEPPTPVKKAAPAPAPTTAAYRLAVAKAQVIQKAGKATSFAKAMALVWKQDPDLYKRHTQERRG
jgi:hypothetical protein